MKIFFIFVKISFIKNVNCFMQNFTCEFFHKVRGGTQKTRFVKYFFMKIFYIKIFTFFNCDFFHKCVKYFSKKWKIFQKKYCENFHKLWKFFQKNVNFFQLWIFSQVNPCSTNSGFCQVFWEKIFLKKFLKFSLDK